MNHEKINFRIERDFSELFNTTAIFFNKNFKHFFRSMILITGPLILIASVFLLLYQYNILSLSQAAAKPKFDGTYNFASLILERFSWTFWVYLIFSSLSNLVLLTTVYAYMMVYTKEGPGNFGVEEVKKEVFQNIGKVIKGFLAIFFLTMAIILIIAAVFFMLSSALKVLVGFLLVIAMLLSPPVIWQMSSFYLVQMEENASVPSAFVRMRELLRGNFFSTWLYMVVVFIAIIILSMLFSIPQSILQVVLKIGHIEQSMMGLYLAVVMISHFFILMIYCIFYFMCGLHYYSLAEKTDGTSLSSRIDEIGNTPAPDMEQHY